MKRWLITASASTAFLIVLNLLAGNVGLWNMGRQGCIVAWQIPFTNRGVRCPRWMWDFAFWLLPISALALLVIWTSVGIRFWKPTYRHARRVSA